MQRFACSIIFSAVGCMLPTASAAPGCAVGYFLINKDSIVFNQNAGRITADVLYSTLWRMHPFTGAHESSMAQRNTTVDTFTVNEHMNKSVSNLGGKLLDTFNFQG